MFESCRFELYNEWKFRLLHEVAVDVNRSNTARANLNPPATAALQISSIFLPGELTLKPATKTFPASFTNESKVKITVAWIGIRSQVKSRSNQLHVHRRNQ